MMNRGFDVTLPALWFLVGSALTLTLTPALTRDCEWSDHPHHGLKPDAAVLDLVQWMEVSDPDKCRAACCAKAACDLAQVGYPMDGGPLCRLVSCMVRGKDVCELEASNQFSVYRKTAKGEAVSGGAEAPRLEPPKLEPLSGGAEAPRLEPPKLEPLVDSEEPRSNESNIINCRLPMKVGSCRAFFPRFFYNVTDQTCHSFIYGGCEANANNFESQESCEATCSGVTGSVLPDESTPAPQEHSVKAARKAPSFSTETSSDEYADRCMVSPDTGHCRAAFPRFYFDHKTGTCQSFLYGGCGGNKNRYDSVDKCMTRCSLDGSFDSRGKTRNRWTAAFFLFVTLAAISALLLVTLVLISVRRHRLSRRTSVSDKEELLPEPDEQSSVSSLSLPESPKPIEA